MLRLIFVSTLALLASADVSHLLGNNRPYNAVPLQKVVVTPVARGSQPQIAILRQSQDVGPDGSYQYNYETENGIAAEERGQVVPVGNEVATAAQGSYSYTSPEGEQVSISYVADANGYQPQGSHLPVAPPVPPAIQRALEWIAAHPQPVEQPTYNGQRRF